MELSKPFNYERKDWIFVHTPEEVQHNELKILLTKLNFDTVQLWENDKEDTYEKYQQDTVVWFDKLSVVNKAAGVQSMTDTKFNPDIKVWPYDEFIREYYKESVNLNNILDELDTHIANMERRLK